MLQGWAKLEIGSIPPPPGFREVDLGLPRCRKVVESLAAASYNFAELSVRLDLPANPDGSLERLCGAVLRLAWYIFHRGLSTASLAGICLGLESTWCPRVQVVGEHNCPSKLALGEFRVDRELFCRVKRLVRQRFLGSLSPGKVVMGPNCSKGVCLSEG